MIVFTCNIFTIIMFVGVKENVSLKIVPLQKGLLPNFDMNVFCTNKTEIYKFEYFLLIDIK